MSEQNAEHAPADVVSIEAWRAQCGGCGILGSRWYGPVVFDEYQAKRIAKEHNAEYHGSETGPA